MGEGHSIKGVKGYMSCEKFLDLIQSEFDYLFEEYNFKVVFTDSATTRDDHCLVILESTYCRVKFYRSYEAADVTLGTTSAPLIWENGWREGKCDINTWFGIHFVLDFLSRRKPDLERLLERKEHLPVSRQLAAIAEKLRPLCSQVLLLFQPQEIRGKELGFTDFVQWRRIVGQEITEALQRRYSIARK